MEHWIMPAYIISGIVMAIGAYLTIRYRPYCTLKSPEREIAMELHRKKLMNEPMNEEEKQLNIINDQDTSKYLYGDLILFIFIPLHLIPFFVDRLDSLSMIYWFSSLLLISKFIHIADNTFCFGWNFKNEGLEECVLYGKLSNGELLSIEESKKIQMDQLKLSNFLLIRFLVNFGVVLHLTLDVWFGISGSLIIN